ncbi:ABC transporter ATP-binding protein [Nocardioides sp. cx-169]|uniref:ABC transporter ATP-binding protein n=1 Tax=Nocardioides sp. cx-169 TaxID=2899080 RepID=UPI001E37F275|nr:ABC transporter ATP-binding protein [Nocardioides sp. cx-169]MCD4536593.1 ABC transporter ATP-binding protein [Nocardioides sp. cx-169]
MAGSGTAHLRGGQQVLAVENLTVEFGGGRWRKPVQAVTGISFDIAEGETLGLVGESGCGKSTTGRAILQLQKKVAGRIEFEGVDLDHASRRETRQMRRHMQTVFQDARSSFNPRRSIARSLEEPLKVWGVADKAERGRLLAAALRGVGINEHTNLDRRPSQFSGGQCQRLSIARALLMEPRLIICDEVVSALDVSIQAQIINLLLDLRASRGLSLLFISHDLAVVKNVSDRVAVMYMGKLCEIAPADDLYAQAAHPYTNVLLDAVPEPDPNIVPRVSEARESGNQMVSLREPPSGCRFRLRCPAAQRVCAELEPQVREVNAGHFVACHFPTHRTSDAPKVEASPHSRASDSVVRTPVLER